MNRMPWILWLLAWLLLTLIGGCEDERVAEVAREAADRQAAQNETMSDGTHPDALGYQRYATPAVLLGIGANLGPCLIVDLETGVAILHNARAIRPSRAQSAPRTTRT